MVDLYSSFSPAEPDVSKDRLLTSEIAELQARVQGLLMENHELRQDLAKIAGAKGIRSGRKVCS